MNFDNYISKLEKELSESDKIELISFHRFKPVTNSLYADYCEKFQLFLPQILADFYTVSNGLQVRWRKKNKPKSYEKEIAESGNPFKWNWPAEHYWQLDGLINLLPLEQFLFGIYKDFMWFDFEEKYSINFLNNTINLQKFKQSLRPFDVYDKYYTVAAYATIDAFHILLGDDHNADFLHYPAITAEKYFEMLFLSKGEIKQRPKFFK